MTEAAERRPFDLSYQEAMTYYSALRQRRRKEERLKAKSTFVPEPGHTDRAVHSIERKLQMEARILAFIAEFPEYDPDEWVDDA